MAWNDILDATIEVSKPITTTLMTYIRDNLVYLKTLLTTHTHDGVATPLIPTGANAIKNGSFEDLVSALAGWSGVATKPASATIVAQQAGAMHGKYCAALTSTVLADGAGSLLYEEYFQVSPGSYYSATALFKASVANVSSRIRIIWYDASKAEISESVETMTDTPTVKTPFGSSHQCPLPSVAPSPSDPNTCGWARVQVYGAVPSVGTAVGTIYVDGVVFAAADNGMTLTAGDDVIGHYYETPLVTVSPSDGMPITKVAQWRVCQCGNYRITFTLTDGGADANASYGQIYKNGVAFGAANAVGDLATTTFTEDLYFSAGDKLQLYLYTDHVPGYPAATITIEDFKFACSPGLVIIPPVHIPLAD